MNKTKGMQGREGVSLTPIKQLEQLIGLPRLKHRKLAGKEWVERVGYLILKTIFLVVIFRGWKSLRINCDLGISLRWSLDAQMNSLVISFIYNYRTQV